MLGCAIASVCIILNKEGEGRGVERFPLTETEWEGAPVKCIFINYAYLLIIRAHDEIIINKYAFHWHIFCCTHIQTDMGLHVGTHKDKGVFFFLYANVLAAPQNSLEKQRQPVANGGPYQSPALAES